MESLHNALAPLQVLEDLSSFQNAPFLGEIQLEDTKLLQMQTSQLRSIHTCYHIDAFKIDNKY
jgi:hypothetical protein